MAAADDVAKASLLGHSSVVAGVFLPEAVEEARRRGVELIDIIEDLAGPMIELMIKALGGGSAGRWAVIRPSYGSANVA